LWTGSVKARTTDTPPTQRRHQQVISSIVRTPSSEHKLSNSSVRTAAIRSELKHIGPKLWTLHDRRH